jgi:predicted nucleic acid-binding protein
LKPADVPPGPLLIDTDVFSWLSFKRGPYEQFEALVEGHLWALSFATVGEVLGLAAGRKMGEQRYGELFDELNRHIILPVTDEVVRIYGRIHGRFTGRLQNKGHNDIWTAACALAQQRPTPIVTGNLRDFQTIATEFPVTIIHPDIEPATAATGPDEPAAT